MQIIDLQTAESYLRDAGHLATGERVRIERLTGGVSNCVLYVHREDVHGPDFVLKQAREQLQVEAPWFCSPERGWQEVAFLQACHGICQEAADRVSASELVFRVPEILFQDEDNFAYAMTAASPDHVVWKSELLNHRCEPALAGCCGELLSLIHARSWQQEIYRQTLGNRQFFHDLRVDPYYRYMVRSHEDLEEVIETLIGSLEQHACALVHGDYSPKNLLVNHGGCMLVDFEVGHFGDPAFDVGFFLSHLVLKAVWSGNQFDQYWDLTRAFWESYERGWRQDEPRVDYNALLQRSILNCAACLLARVDGKSPVEYLDTEPQRFQVRQLARRMLLEMPTTWNEVVMLVEVV